MLIAIVAIFGLLSVGGLVAYIVHSEIDYKRMNERINANWPE